MAGLWFTAGDAMIHVHLPDNRARWRDNAGRWWYMEFHNYCGPQFSQYPDFDDGGSEPPEEIWDRFDEWFEAVKGEK